MKYVKYKNNRFCKIIIFVFVVIFGFSVLVFKSDNKVKAGVVVDEAFTIYNFGSDSISRTWDINDINNKYLGISNFNLTQGLLQFDASFTNSNNNRRTIYYGITNIDQSIPSTPVVYWRSNSFSSTYTSSTRGYFQTHSDKTYAFTNFKTIIEDLEQLVQQQYSDSTYTFTSMVFSTNVINNFGLTYATFGASITQIENIYDLPQNSVAILYLVDISGLNTSDYADEITINWGFIDDSDNTSFSVYSPKITAYHDTEEEEIGIGIPQNAGGSATTYQVMKHNTLLSLYDSTYQATANIYAVYVHLTESTISWGLVSFNCTSEPPTPTAQSMQYITNSTQIYTYTAANSTQMTCRLSVSSNFNYITILNQNTFNIGYINPILRSGGFFPAWACYNWARGQTTGYATGYNAGQLPYQVGGTGYNEIYQAGYLKGQEDSVDTSFLVNLFDSVDSLFSIHLFPFLTIGEIVGIPFVISVVWFIIKQLRGGGGAD